MDIHLCNKAARLIPEYRLLHTMQEDNDLEGDDEARSWAVWLERWAPGQFILIDTGDQITAECAKALTPGHFNCQTYDMTHALYLVPTAVWEGCKEQVLAVDQEWREQASRCRQIPTKEVAAS